MGTQTFGWTAPASPDLSDSTTELSLGVLFKSSVAGPCTGGTFWVPPTRPTGPTPGRVQLWTATGTILAGKTFDWATVGTPGTFASVTFDGTDVNIDGGPPVTLVPDDFYMISVQTFERFGGTSGFGWPVTVGVLTANANNGWLKLGYGFPDIQSGLGFNYGISPNVTVSDGAASLIYGGLALAGIGTRTKDGAGVLAYGGLSLAATGTKARDGAASLAYGGLQIAARGGSVAAPRQPDVYLLREGVVVYNRADTLTYRRG